MDKPNVIGLPADPTFRSAGSLKAVRWNEGAGSRRRLCRRSPTPNAPGACIPLLPLCPQPGTLAADRIDEADEVISECLLNAPQDPNSLGIRAAVKVRKGELAAARETMAELVAANTGFSLASEASYRRFGNSPLMERCLSELAQAQAPRTADSAIRSVSDAT